MRLLPEETCCVVVDIQEKFMPVIAEAKELVAGCERLLAGLRILGIPVMVTAQYVKGLGLTLPEIRAAAGTEEFCDKKSFSIYGDAAARERLASFGRKNVILCGIETHVCVLQSVMDLKAAGYQPVLAEDCVSSRRLRDKETALLRARAEGAVVTGSESLLFELTGSADHPCFKQISALVK